MSEESVLLQEYFDSLGLDRENITKSDLKLLAEELKSAGEIGLATWVLQLKNPEDILDYFEEEENV